MNDESEIDVNTDDKHPSLDGKRIPLDPETTELFLRLRKESIYIDQITDIGRKYLKHKRKVEETPGDLLPIIELIYRAIYNYLFRNVPKERIQDFWNDSATLKSAAQIIRDDPSHFISLMGESLEPPEASSKAVEAIEAMASYLENTPKPPERANKALTGFLGQTFSNEPVGLSARQAVEIEDLMNEAIKQALVDNAISQRTVKQLYIEDDGTLDARMSNARKQLRKGEEKGCALAMESKDNTGE